jgi:hypothetical protein
MQLHSRGGFARRDNKSKKYHMNTNKIIDKLTRTDPLQNDQVEEFE